MTQTPTAPAAGPDRSATTPVIEAIDIVAGYLPGVNILNGCSLVAYPGEMIGIIGPNGAGKSTLLKAMFGLVKVHSGRVNLNGEGVTNHRADKLVQAGVGFVPQNNNVFPSLTIEENLRMGLYLRPRSCASGWPPPGTCSRCSTTAATRAPGRSRAVSGSRWPWPARS